MPLKPACTAGRLTAGSYCPEHEPQEVGVEERDGQAFRVVVLPSTRRRMKGARR
jgi:hypothetical protein